MIVILACSQNQKFVDCCVFVAELKRKGDFCLQQEGRKVFYVE
jgi:hypothetical protein